MGAASRTLTLGDPIFRSPVERSIPSSSPSPLSPRALFVSLRDSLACQVGASHSLHLHLFFSVISSLFFIFATLREVVVPLESRIKRSLAKSHKFYGRRELKVPPSRVAPSRGPSYRGHRSPGPRKSLSAYCLPADRRTRRERERAGERPTTPFENPSSCRSQESRATQGKSVTTPSSSQTKIDRASIPFRRSTFLLTYPLIIPSFRIRSATDELSGLTYARDLLESEESWKSGG